MMSLKLPLLSALLVSASAALATPTHLKNSLSLVTINDTNISPQAPPQHGSNLTFSPWPAQPYLVPVHNPWGATHNLVINIARSYRGTRPIRVQRLLDFVEEFRDNIEQEYPVPGYLPRQAKQGGIDIDSYTTWTIETNEGPFGYRLTTEMGLLALNELVNQIRRHGPANMLFSILEQRATLSYGFLTIEEFGGGSLSASSANGGRDFQTS